MSPDALAYVEDEAAIKDENRDLPDGWVRARMAEVASINPSTSFDGLPDDAVVPFVPMSAVTQETGTIDTSQRRPLRAVRKGYVRFREGDVIFAKITPCMENGKIAPVCGIEGGYAAGSTEFHVFRPRCVEARYLWYWLVRRAFRGDAERNMSGSAGQLRVPVGYLRSSSIPLAPMSEQRRIVARIDDLFAEITEGEAALERARQGLDVWRRALVKAAVTGELTHEWREANRPTETGTKLLARIEASRPAASGLGNRRRRQAQALPDIDALPVVPQGWAWARLGDLGEIVGGVTVDKKRVPAEPVNVPYLRVANVQRGYLDLSEIKSILVERTIANRLELKVNDILLNEGGDRDKIGRGWVWRGEVPTCIHQNHASLSG